MPVDYTHFQSSWRWFERHINCQINVHSNLGDNEGKHGLMIDPIHTEKPWGRKNHGDGPCGF